MVRRVLVTLAAVAAAVCTTAPAHGAAGPSPYRAALHCPARFDSGREPVLLVHGTGLNADESWSWNYAQALPGRGYDVCSLDLPGFAMGDIQVSADYVRYAVTHIAARTHRKVEVITHSQGGMEARWAVRWFPRVRRDVDDLIMLASPNHGIAAADVCAAAGSCWPAVWQMAGSSRFLAALNRGDETPGAVSYTNVFSRTDELVEPSSTVPMRGAANIAIQDICLRPVHHAGLLTDSVAWALVLDALTHRGPADADRIPATVCAEPFAPGMGASAVAAGNLTLYSQAALHFAQAPGTSHEPPLRRYAR
ncbi:MAG TPA: alpha/beta fold hydrolase [Mycobacteriales bacterium]|nr:alpha/beta fold hydrolase [Mycobacteriales bacterium]